MEWIEIVGKTIEEARQDAAKRLGVSQKELEVQVLEEPKPGLFGRIKGEARIRARIKPRSHFVQKRTFSRSYTRASSNKPQGQNKRTTNSNRGRQTIRQPGKTTRVSRQSRPVNHVQWSSVPEEEVERVKELSRQFVQGVVDAFEFKGDVKIESPEGESLPVKVDGEGLGLLVGPGGSTLMALQELLRTVVKYQAKVPVGRVDLDIANYRQRRIKALEEFALRLADEVKREGKAKALEPMMPADRKVVHTVLANVEGVITYSKGDDPYRYVVIAPGSQSSPQSDSK